MNSEEKIISILNPRKIYSNADIIHCHYRQPFPPLLNLSTFLDEQPSKIGRIDRRRDEKWGNDNDSKLISYHEVGITANLARIQI